jgi:FKBP-type peptidyl-prolyl cis-trans isomerase FkpA
MRTFFTLSLLSLLFISCGKKKAEKQAKIDDDLIVEYIAANGLNATKTSSGLYYVIQNQGTGASCNSFSDVRVAYKGYFVDGSVFDESSEQGISFNLQQVIKGWTEGIPLFKEGGNGILLIPSALAYGTKDKGSVPANSVLLFDVKLIEVL